MDEITLYYTLSAIPQILAATSAVLAAFIHFRLTTVHNILVGDGKATLDRARKDEKGETGYILDDGQRDRLRDWVYRKSIAEIKEILIELKDIEIKEGFTKQDRPTWLQYLFDDRFCPTEKHYTKLKKSSIQVIGLCLATIIIAVISLSLTDHLNTNILKNIFLYTNVGLFILSITLSFILVRYSNTYNTIQENTEKRNRTIEKNTKHPLS